VLASPAATRVRVGPAADEEPEAAAAGRFFFLHDFDLVGVGVASGASVDVVVGSEEELEGAGDDGEP